MEDEEDNLRFWIGLAWGLMFSAAFWAVVAWYLISRCM